MLHAKKAADIEVMHFDVNGVPAHLYLCQVCGYHRLIIYGISDVTIKTFTEQRIESVSTKSMNWRSFLNPDDISTLTKSPGVFLHRVVFACAFLACDRSGGGAYALALWRRLAEHDNHAMLLLSIPFVFGSVRTGLGNKLVLASMLGSVFTCLIRLSRMRVYCCIESCANCSRSWVVLIVLANSGCGGVLAACLFFPLE